MVIPANFADQIGPAHRGVGPPSTSNHRQAADNLFAQPKRHSSVAVNFQDIWKLGEETSSGGVNPVAR